MNETDDTPEQPWRPLHVRDSPKRIAAYDEPFDGVPPHLESSLRQWIVSYVYDDWDRLRELERILRLQWPSTEGGAYGTLLRAWESSSPEQRLSIVDAALHSLRERFDQGDRYEKEQQVEQVKTLSRYLDQAGSLWRVAVGPDERLRLYRRLPEASRAQLQALEETGGTAAQELLQAWHYCYKRDPQPRVAYEHAVVAVEGAACAALTPKDGRPSLGKVIDHLEQTPGRYTVAGLEGRGSSSQETMLGMLRLVAHNQPRHAGSGGDARADVDHPTAEAIVAVSITLVHWLTGGLVRRVDS